MALLSEEPPGTGDEHWDVLLAALAEHLAARADASSTPLRPSVDAGSSSRRKNWKARE